MTTIKQYNKAITSAVVAFLVTYFAQNGIDIPESALIALIEPIVASAILGVSTWAVPNIKAIPDDDSNNTV